MFNWCQSCEMQVSVPGLNLCWSHLSPSQQDLVVRENAAVAYGAARARVVDLEARKPVKTKAQLAFTKERRNGAKVVYPSSSHEVPSIWTPTKCYPYPNWKRKLGLASSYPTEKCKVVFPGWTPGEKKKEEKANVN